MIATKIIMGKMIKSYYILFCWFPKHKFLHWKAQEALSWSLKLYKANADFNSLSGIQQYKPIKPNGGFTEMAESVQSFQ